MRHAGGHDGVADHDGQAAVLRGTHRAKLEAVAAEGEGRGAVAVLDVGLDVHGRTAASLLQETNSTGLYASSSLSALRIGPNTVCTS